MKIAWRASTVQEGPAARLCAGRCTRRVQPALNILFAGSYFVHGFNNFLRCCLLNGAIVGQSLHGLPFRS
jgi:hypothetical protein